jgi:hypothetical protein
MLLETLPLKNLMCCFHEIVRSKAKILDKFIGLA